MKFFRILLLVLILLNIPIFLRASTNDAIASFFNYLIYALLLLFYFLNKKNKLAWPLYYLQIPTYITSVIMVRFLESIKKNSFMTLADALFLILNIILNYILIKKIGVYGLALATSFVTIINGLALYGYINHINKSNLKHY